ncbi:hypothetical protein J3A83DRAFT_4232795 [Scleroderma citrinum]
MLLNKLKERILHSNSFCCCIPVRIGFMLMTVLTFLVTGAISVIIWFEVSHSYQLSTNERVAFILIGIAESLLFLFSIAGFVGAVARKQSFVMLYTYFLYTHLVLNVIVGIYFLVTIRKGNRQQLVDYCASVFTGTSAESNCTSLTSIPTYVFIAIVVLLLLLELYGTVIATRYVYHLRIQKKDDRSRRLGYFHALSVPPSGHTRQPSDDIELLGGSTDASYSTVPYVDPYDIEDHVVDIGMPSTTDYSPLGMHDRNSRGDRRDSARPPLLTTSSNGSSRSIRALPPRPRANFASDALVDAGPPKIYPDFPLGPNARRYQELLSPDGEDNPESPGTAELSTTAHSALMDHAAYMRPVFSSSAGDRPALDAPPPYSGPKQRLRLGKRP